MDRFLSAYDAVLANWPVPHRALDVHTRFGTTRVQVCGPEGGAPLVLLPGGGATSTVWFANVEALHRSNRVFAVDIVGDAGRSVPDRGPRDRAELMSWLDEVLDRLGLEQASLCGHSYGAWIALAYALHAPGRVRRLALLDPTTCFAGMSPRYLWHALPLLLRPSGGRLRALLRWEQGAQSDARSGAAGDLREAWLDLSATVADEVPTKIVMPRRPSRDQLRGLSVPTLVLLAGASRAHDVDRVAATARTLLPDVTVEALPGVSHHGMPFVRAVQLNARLVEFLG